MALDDLCSSIERLREHLGEPRRLVEASAGSGRPDRGIHLLRGRGDPRGWHYSTSDAGSGRTRSPKGRPPPSGSVCPSIEGRSRRGTCSATLDDTSRVTQPPPTSTARAACFSGSKFDDFDAAVARATELHAEVVLAPHRNPPPGQSGGPAHREIWLRDLDGYIVVLASPDGEAAEIDETSTWVTRLVRAIVPFHQESRQALPSTTTTSSTAGRARNACGRGPIGASGDLFVPQGRCEVCPEVLDILDSDAQSEE